MRLWTLLLLLLLQEQSCCLTAACSTDQRCWVKVLRTAVQSAAAAALAAAGLHSCWSTPAPAAPDPCWFAAAPVTAAAVVCPCPCLLLCCLLRLAWIACCAVASQQQLSWQLRWLRSPACSAARAWQQQQGCPWRRPCSPQMPRRRVATGQTVLQLSMSSGPVGNRCSPLMVLLA